MSPPASKSSSLLGYLNFSTLAVVLTAVYVYHVSRSVYFLMNPLATVAPNHDPTVDPLWDLGEKIQIQCYLSPSSSMGPALKGGSYFEVDDSESTALKKLNRPLLWNKTDDLVYDWIYHNQPQRKVWLRPYLPLPEGSDSGNDTDGEVHISSSYWEKLTQGKAPAFLHVYITKSGYSPNPNDPNHDKDSVILGIVNLVKETTAPPKVIKHRNLLKEPLTPVIVDADANKTDRATDTGKFYLWKPEVAIRIVVDFNKYPLYHIPQSIHNTMRAKRFENDGKYRYLPNIYVDEMGLTSDKYTSLNSTVKIDSLQLTLSFESMALGRWLLLKHFEQSFKNLRELGFGEEDENDMRHLIADTSINFLCLTILASTLHLLFEFLAFKSDIHFWKNVKSLGGLSVRSLFIELVCMTIIFFYLIEEKGSMLVTGPGAFGIFIQLWKIQKATGISLWRRNPASGSLEFGIKLDRCEKECHEDDGGHIARVSQEMDRVAINHLSLVLFPLLVGSIIQSLIMSQHRSWYSWLLGSTTNCVYTFGFILMTPQLFLNYKLKSVSHMPWRYMCYKFINTFIDDIFAFIIKMPTAHRISCFRDDIIFLIYLYQRWIYPVDRNRPTVADD